ncbi:hypothetical protein IWZ01DRAFT_166717 [Phyllosticta capitalensis]
MRARRAAGQTEPCRQAVSQRQEFGKGQWTDLSSDRVQAGDGPCRQASSGHRAPPLFLASPDMEVCECRNSRLAFWHVTPRELWVALTGPLDAALFYSQPCPSAGTGPAFGGCRAGSAGQEVVGGEVGGTRVRPSAPEFCTSVCRRRGEEGRRGRGISIGLGRRERQKTTTSMTRTKTRARQMMDGVCRVFAVSMRSICLFALPLSPTPFPVPPGQKAEALPSCAMIYLRHSRASFTARTPPLSPLTVCESTCWPVDYDRTSSIGSSFLRRLDMEVPLSESRSNVHGRCHARWLTARPLKGTFEEGGDELFGGEEVGGVC